MILGAVPVQPDKIQIEVSMRASLGEWKALRAVILELQGNGHPRVSGQEGGTEEPFWSLIYRLEDIIHAVQKQHTSYP